MSNLLQKKLKIRLRTSSTPKSMGTDSNTRGGSNIDPANTLTSAQNLDSFLLNARWKEPNENRMKRVLIKEKAAKDALLACKEMIRIMSNGSLVTASCRSRIDKINTVIGRNNTYQILIGFLGATGSGKTTLINALISSEHLLPSSTWRACTAVAVEIAWNASNDQNSLYRAEIVYSTSDEWLAELHQFFVDLEAPATADDDDDDGTEDMERQERIAQAFDKLKCVYPRFKKVDHLRSSSAEMLINDTAVKGRLGTTVRINQANKNVFAAEIMKLIDSGNRSGKESAHWPLVKLVKVFVKCPFLEHGITLVDLPGNHDSNAARSAIAEQYQKEMSVTCIVTPAQRGMDDKSSHDLLERITKRNLQLDGLYNSESLCVVVSQTDGSFDARAHIRAEPALQSIVADDQAQMVRLVMKRKQLVAEKEAIDAALKVARELVRKLFGEIHDLEEQLGHQDNASTCLNSNGKRPANEHHLDFHVPEAGTAQVITRRELANTRNALSTAQRDLQEAEDKCGDLERQIRSIDTRMFWARSRIHVACIQSRNDLSTTAIRREFEDTLVEMGRTPTEPLNVFCVASLVYMKYQKDGEGKKIAAFPTRGHTQVPALRDWLVSTTLSKRESYAQAFLEDVEALLCSILPWVNDKYGDLKMSADVRGIWEPRLERELVYLKENLSRLALGTFTSMTQHVHTTLYSTIPDAEAVAAENAKATVTRWLLEPPERKRKLHWSTHRSINRQHGDWVDTKGNKHQWNADIVFDLTSALLPHWENTFQVKFPSSKAGYIDAACKFIAEFAKTVSGDDLCPDVADGLSVLTDHILRTQNVLKVQTDTAFEDLQNLMRDIHRAPILVVKEALGLMYDTCGNEKGKNHYARNKKAHKQTMRSQGLAIHRKSSTVLRSGIDDMLKGLTPKLEATHKAVIDTIQDEIALFFKQNTTSGVRLSKRKVASVSKIRLRADLLAVLVKLGKDWQSELTQQTHPEQVDAEDIEDIPFQDGEFVAVGEDPQDSDYVDE